MPSPDYQRYSDKDLNDVLTRIDKENNSANYQRLMAEITKRNIAKKEKEQNQLSSQNNEQKDEAFFNREYLREYWDPQNALKEQKSISTLYGLWMLLIVGGVFCLPAYFHTFLIEKAYANYFSWAASVVAIIALILSPSYFYKRALQNNQQQRIFNFDTEEAETNFKKFSVVVTALIFSMFSYFITAEVLPVIVHLYLVEHVNAQKTVTVAEKNTIYRRRNCNGKVHLREYQYTMFDYICTSRHTFEHLKEGDKLRVFGTQSKMGFLVTGSAKAN